MHNICCVSTKMVIYIVVCKKMPTNFVNFWNNSIILLECGLKVNSSSITTPKYFTSTGTNLHNPITAYSYIYMISISTAIWRKY